MALFEKGKSGNPAGKPKGTKAKSTLIAEAFLENGQDVHKLIMQTWISALKPNPKTGQPYDIKTAGSMAAAAMKFAYSIPDGGSDIPESTAESHVINFVTVSSKKE